MNILVSIEELRFGGAQTFALRLAQALAQRGHKVWIYTLYDNLTLPDLVARLAPDVPVLAYRPPVAALDGLLQRAEGWLERRNIRLSWRARMLRNHVRHCIQEHAIDVVSSNTFKSDEVMAQALQAAFPKVPLIVTMHGDYEQFWEFYQQHDQYVLPDYPERLRQTLARTTAVAYLAEQNLRVLAPDVVPPAATAQLECCRIYNGLEGQYSPERERFSRQALGIPANAFVIGMVARGVPEKGWQPLLAAYQLLRQDEALTGRPVHVILVGSSPFLDKLRQQYTQDKQAHFLGFVDNPIDCVPAFDVGVLASSLKESLPNSIAEYLFAGRPVVSTEVGEIRNMLSPALNPQQPAADEPREDAGFLIDFPAPGAEADPSQLYTALRRYYTEPELLARHQQLAKLAFRKFSMPLCISSYTSLYERSRARLLAAG